MAILLLADHDNASLSDQTAKTLTAAAKIGGDVHVLVAGKGAKAVADAGCQALRRLQGPARRQRRPGQQPRRAARRPDRLAGGSYDTIISAATSVGKNVLPRVAALLDVAQVSEIIEVVSADTFKRPIYAGNAIQTVQSTDAKKVITVRTASFAAAAEGGSASVETMRPKPIPVSRPSSRMRCRPRIARN
jgi:electron transfer flavoprotein alpha subunit